MSRDVASGVVRTSSVGDGVAAMESEPASPNLRAAPGAGHQFGTAPVFLASISTILGAILFLRFGYAVGNLGMLGALVLVLLGHLVTVPTALAIAEIATNRRVEGGGEYFIISRSFGRTVGASIGVALYISQAISVAFYMIAFGESFRPLASTFESWSGLTFDVRLISLPAMGILLLLVLSRGADIGVKALWWITVVLALALAVFFAGKPVPEVAQEPLALARGIPDGDSFMLVFAIVFPAFTGMTAGVGLSGDLANPRRSLPLGVLSATLVGLVIYLAVTVKLAVSAPASLLASDPLVMSRIAIWPPMIAIGLACATLSSALGSILVAPRTLQALAGDGVAPWRRLNAFLSAGFGNSNEPRNGTVVTAFIAIATVAAGSVDFVARIVSMFFMVTYGSLCAISFLEHFAARPSYRPTFRSKWYLSLLGAVLCLLLMFQMDPAFALLSIALMTLIYLGIRSSGSGRDDLAEMFRGVMAQTSRYFQLQLQRSTSLVRDWRPNVVAVTEHTFDRAAPVQLLTWICRRQGFGTLLHLIRGRLDRSTQQRRLEGLPRLVELSKSRESGLFVDSIVAPSMQEALSHAFQMPSATGRDHNLALFAFSDTAPDAELVETIEGCNLAWESGLSLLMLRYGERHFGARRTIHLWLTWHDFENAPLMILVTYILLGHPDWSAADVKIFAAFPREDAAREGDRLVELIESGRLPISRKNLEIIPTASDTDFTALVACRSATADLVLFGLTRERLDLRGVDLLRRHESLGDVLFLSAAESITIQ